MNVRTAKGARKIMDLIQFKPKAKVFVENGKAWVSSRDVAEDFEKEHKNVLRDIQNLDCSEEFTRLNFELSEYTDPTGRKLPMYLISRDGFTFLAMGFTGEKAAKFKEAYIALFNEYESGSVDFRSWALELKGLTESLVSTSNAHECRVTDLEKAVFQDHERRLQTVELKTKDYKRISEPVKRIHDAFGSMGYQNHCPMCGQIAVRWNYDHMEDVEKADQWHTWRICKECHDKLTFNRELRTEIRLTDYATYQRRLKEWKPTVKDFLSDKPLFAQNQQE